VFSIPFLFMLEILLSLAMRPLLCPHSPSSALDSPSCLADRFSLSTIILGPVSCL
jgi:hypothetical protein